jgi:epoxyqueuosine reductase
VNPVERAQLVKNRARELGFDHCGIARAEPIGRADYVRAWLAAGRAGSMDYLRRHLEQRLDPRNLLDGAQSVIVTALLYHQAEPAEPVGDDRPRGRVASYAWGRDYHRVVKRKLHALADSLRDVFGAAHTFKACVDTAPLLERELAAMAGIGWIGKNTMVLNQRLGSYFFLGALVTTLELAVDEPVADHCGSCTACLDACPTRAFPAAYKMDASRCISYFTIEHRGVIPPEFHKDIGDWLFGCDVCQEVCPFNRQAPTTREADFAVRPPGPTPMLEEVLSWTEEDYDKQLAGSAARRATLAMWKRNAEIVKRNAEALPS